ncbi:MAG: hypothetical protein ACOYBB_00695 [Blautia sp.]
MWIIIAHHQNFSHRKFLFVRVDEYDFVSVKDMQESEKSATEAGSRFGKFYVSASLQNTLPLMRNRRVHLCPPSCG